MLENNFFNLEGVKTGGLYCIIPQFYTTQFHFLLADTFKSFFSYSALF